MLAPLLLGNFMSPIDSSIFPDPQIIPPEVKRDCSESRQACRKIVPMTLILDATLQTQKSSELRILRRIRKDVLIHHCMEGQDLSKRQIADFLFIMRCSIMDEERS